MKIKILEAITAAQLQEEINKWIDKENPQITDIEYQVACPGGPVRYSALILYSK